MNPTFLKFDGTVVPLTALDFQWSDSKGERFTATTKAIVTGKITALGLFGIVRPVKMDKVHATESRTAFAGSLLDSEEAATTAPENA